MATTTDTASTYHLDNLSKNDLKANQSYDDINTSVPSTPVTPYEGHDQHVVDEKTNTLPDPEELAIAVERSTHPRAGISKWAWIFTLVGQYTGALLFGLDTTITATVQASIYKVGETITGSTTKKITALTTSLGPWRD